MTAEAKQATSRDDKGRFLPGHSVRSPGRPPREVEREYLRAFRTGCPPERLAKIVDVLAAKAEAGNLDACKLILRHALPAAAMRIELAAEGEEFRVAGMSASEVNDSMLRRLATKIKERREYENSLRQNGVKLGDESSAY